MDTFDFKISVNKYYDIWNYTILCIILSLLVLGSWKIIPISPIVLFSAVIIFAIDATVMYFKKIKQKYKTLSVQENLLIIEDNPPIEIDYMKIQSITLKGGSVKGTSWLGVAYSPIAIPNTGQENTIKIITMDGRKIVRNIWCENDADYCRLRSLGSFLKEKEIDIKMKGFG